MRGMLGHVICALVHTERRSGSKPLDRSFQQPFRFDFQCCCDPHHDEQAGVAPPSLNATDIGQVDVGFEGKLFLGQSRRLAQPPHIPTNNSAPVRHCQRNDNRAYIL